MTFALSTPIVVISDSVTIDTCIAFSMTFSFNFCVAENTGGHITVDKKKNLDHYYMARTVWHQRYRDVRGVENDQEEMIGGANGGRRQMRSLVRVGEWRGEAGVFANRNLQRGDVAMRMERPQIARAGEVPVSVPHDGMVHLSGGIVVYDRVFEEGKRPLWYNVNHSSRPNVEAVRSLRP